MTQWTREPPKEPGVYWTRDWIAVNGAYRAAVAELTEFGSIKFIGDERDYEFGDVDEWGPRVLPPGEDDAARRFAEWKRDGDIEFDELKRRWNALNDDAGGALRSEPGR